MYLKDLNHNQKKAVLSESNSLLIVAGAGTGKTKTLTTRLIHLLNKGIKPENICAITFTNKAAKEMILKTSKTLAQLNKDPNILKNLFIGTFHSLGAKILREECPVLGRDKNFVIFDDNDSFALIKKIIKDKKLKNSASYFYDQISKIKNNKFILNDDEFGESFEIEEDVLGVFEEYEKILKNQNAFDFDDLISKTVLLFYKNKNSLKKYQQKFQYILVDEYQDINDMQYELIRLLAQNHKNINVVGDDAQTIYSWRGSNIEIFLNFEKDWPKTEIVFLEEGYRSTQNILKAANSIISKNNYQKPKNIWTKNEEGELIKIIETKDEEEEAEVISEKIKKIIKEKKYNSCAILYRINAQSRAIESALNLASIPYKIFGGIRFYERKEIKDILAGVRMIYNPKDYLSKERLEKVFNKTTYLNFLNAISEIKDDSPIKAIDLFLKNTNYLNYLKANFQNFEERIENIEELIHFASEFNNLGEFLERVALLQPHDEKNKNAFLELMTIHLAKGLEFDCVFIIGANEGILPHNLSFKSNKEIEEERRLMYVAMTRARKELFISFYRHPSRFLFDIPEELIEFESTTSSSDKLIDDEMNYIYLP
jgi:DNA helicase-2/ATP-dependent DNA helicase PcrA